MVASCPTPNEIQQVSFKAAAALILIRNSKKCNLVISNQMLNGQKKPKYNCNYGHGLGNIPNPTLRILREKIVGPISKYGY